MRTLPVTDLRYIRPEQTLPVAVAGFEDEVGIGKAYRAGWIDVATRLHSLRLVHVRVLTATKRGGRAAARRTGQDEDLEFGPVRGRPQPGRHARCV